jgi:hypothetical protein
MVAFAGVGDCGYGDGVFIAIILYEDNEMRGMNHGHIFLFSWTFTSSSPLPLIYQKSKTRPNALLSPKSPFCSSPSKPQ